MRIQTVIFDADGVLQGPGDGWKSTFAELVGIFDDQTLYAFGSQVKAAEKRTLDGSVDFAEAIAPILADWSIRAPLQQVVDQFDRIVVDSDMIAEVQRLRADGIRCGLLTNQHHERAALMRTENGFDELFDFALYSCDLGRTKPDPALFAAALGHLGHPGEEALFVDDHEHNVVAAREAGLRAEPFAKHGGRVELRRILALYAL